MRLLLRPELSGSLARIRAAQLLPVPGVRQPAEDRFLGAARAPPPRRRPGAGRVHLLLIVVLGAEAAGTPEDCAC